MLKVFAKYSARLSLILVLACAQLAFATDKGLFWKVESPTGVTSYLFGTIHTDDSRVTDFSPNMIAALKSVDTFMMEVSPSRDQSLLMLKAGTLENMLNEQELVQVRDLADFHAMHLNTVLRMKPWLLAVIFDLPKPQTPFAQDNLLMAKSEELEKSIVGIEGAQEHFGVMDSFSMDEQMIMLRAALKRTPEQKEKDFERLISAYLKGDSDKVCRLDEEITGGSLPKALWQKMRQKLLLDRNKIMTERTLPVASQKSVFIAVGASHLAGKSGLIAAYKKAGFKLSPLKP
jgi:uncharacterized protein